MLLYNKYITLHCLTYICILFRSRYLFCHLNLLNAICNCSMQVKTWNKKYGTNKYTDRIQSKYGIFITPLLYLRSLPYTYVFWVDTATNGFLEEKYVRTTAWGQLKIIMLARWNKASYSSLLPMDSLEILFVHVLLCSVNMQLDT